MTRRHLIGLGLVTALVGVAATACSCSGTATPSAPNVPAGSSISVSIFPTSAKVIKSRTFDFRVTATGTSTANLAWSILEGTDPALVGTIESSGKYWAPSYLGTFHVKVASTVDSTKAATAEVIVGNSAGTLQTQGRFLLDACGNKFLARGPEQLLGYGMEGPGDGAGTYDGLIDQIASTGANALRLLPNSDPGQPFDNWGTAQIAKLDRVLSRACTTHHMIVYLSYYADGRAGGETNTNTNARTYFWNQQGVKDLVNKYSTCLVVDGLQENGYWDVARWRLDALAAVDWFRAQGYTQPLDIMGNGYGRDLPSIIVHGQEILNRDPLKRIVFGWQAYWGTGGYYTNDGFAGKEGLSSPTSPADGIRRAAEMPFPIQAGLLNMAEPEMELVDYQTAMTQATTSQLGWLWWWGSFNGYNDNNILTNTQYWDAAHLKTPYGPIVVWTHAQSIHNSAVRACVP